MQSQIFVFLLCALYGSVFSFGKLALEHTSPLFLTGTRMCLAGTILLLYQFMFNRKDFILRKEHFWPLIWIALTGVYLTNALEFWGLQYMEAGKACFLYSFTPIATAILSYFWFGEKLTYQKLLGLGLGILGFVPILVTHSSAETRAGAWGLLSLAELAILGAAVATSIGWTLMRIMVKNHHYSSVMSNALTMLLGGVFSLIHSYFEDGWAPLPIEGFYPFLGWMLVLCLVSNLISYNLHAHLLKKFTATYLSFAGLTQPIFAAFFGWIFLQEIMSLYFWISALCVTGGLYIYYREELRQGQILNTAKT